MSDNNELMAGIKVALQAFESKPLRESSIALLNTLGYQSDKTIKVEKSDPKAFIELLYEHNPGVRIDKDKALFNNWEKADVLFQLTDEELVKDVARGSANTQLLQSYLFFAIELNHQDYARGKLIAIARQLNRVFPMPVMVLIKHRQLLSIAVINRKRNKRVAEKDVLGRATIIRDISLRGPHTGHIQILNEFALQNLKGVNSFDTLHAAWEEKLNIELLSKKFYKELSNWYFWAINEVSFPKEPTRESFFEQTGLNDEDKLKEAIHEHNAKNVIRLLTRFLFTWFIKEKQLIPDELFDVDYLQKEMLKDLSPYHKDGLFNSANIESHYYKAILQNLFFATLNQDMGKRAFRRSGQNMNVTNLLRYESYFKRPDKFIELVEKCTPFMNGGLFECLDMPHHSQKGRKGGDVIMYEDGFSDRRENSLKVPDFLFFGHDEEVDLSSHFNSKDKKYKKAAVKGLINIFNSYKFTVAENTPVDQEIALDPELLGKVFENLLASYNPETKTTARKQTGSFYTPREIVGYMVDESLIAYLKNKIEGWGVGVEGLDAKLHKLLSYDDSNPFQNNQSLQEKIIQAINHCKIIDPACGSGAFPMGILQKIVHILQKVDPDNAYWKKLQIENAAKDTETVFDCVDDKESREQKLIEINEAFDKQVNDPDYARKLFLIENCLYGVDIQPIAIQISKLRFFISLVADQKVDSNKMNFGIRPLPNLETKFVAANTLIGIDNQGKQMTLYNPELKKLESELIDIRHRIFSAKTPHTKRKLRDKDKEVRDKMGELLKNDGWSNETANQLADWDPYNQNVSSNFFDPEWMFGIMEGFDVVIGNPPYIKEYTDKKAFDGLRDSPYYQGKMDLWYLFACNGIDILKENSVLSFIATNNWVTNFGASKMRNKVIRNTRILKLFDFNNFKIFDSAGIQTMIMMLQKDSISDDYEFDYRKLNNQAVNFSNVLALLNNHSDNTNEKFSPIVNRKNFKDKSLIFNNSLIESVLQKIQKLENFNFKDTEIAQGIVCPQDSLNKRNNKKLDNAYEAGDGIFVLSNFEFQALNLSTEEKRILKPYFSSNELYRYYGDKNNKYWIIYTPSEFNNPKKINSYPNIKTHLNQFIEVITSDNKPYGLHRARAERFFKDEKIISLRKCSDRPVFTYTDFDCYVSATFYVIKTTRINLISMTGFLNSSLCTFWLRYKGKMQGNNYQIDKEPLVNIPIPSTLGDFENPIIELVKQIISLKGLNPNEDTLYLEQEIDQLVYNLYELTEEEIEIIENSQNSR